MLHKHNFNVRYLMEMALDVMTSSVSERRADGKISPKVGAVLYLRGEIQSASRGELRDGDHAEFTLLERKNRDRSLEGGILFATLEPCAPGARKHPKRSCAERIVDARIKKVYIGIEDDDPTVARKGIKYLEDHGVEWEMFDRDLQEKIYLENEVFFKWARSQVGKEEIPLAPIKLSDLEDTASATKFSDLSTEALDHYRKKAAISFGIDSEQFGRILLQQGFLAKIGAELIPTRLGILTFGEKPRDTLPEAGLLATVTFADGSQSKENFDQALVLIPQRLEIWLNNILPQIIDRNQMERKEAVNLPFEMIREGVVNALIHRDYEIKGTKCHLQVTADKITIMSPGAPIKPITISQLQNFSAPMISRNPALHYVFHRMDLAEERGLGLESLKGRAQELNLPLPVYSFHDPCLCLTVFRTRGAASRAVPSDILQQLKKDEIAGWEWISTKQSFISSDYTLAANVSDRTALRHLKHFQSLGLIGRKGSGPSTSYEVIRM